MAEESARARFKIGGENYELDFGELTLDEIGVIEDLTGKTLAQLDEDEWQSARAIKGIAWIAMSRRNPRFTLEEAGRLRLSEFSFSDDAEVENGKPKRPTRAAGAAKSGGS